MYEIGPFQYTFKSNFQTSAVAKKVFCNEMIKINKNEMVIITGPSGAGKSTLLQLLKGIIPEFTNGKLVGSIQYKNHLLHGENFQKNLREIIFLFQNPFSQLIYPKAQEEFFFSMENFNFTRDQMDQKKQELQKYFDLDSLWNKQTTQLSNGECQRLVLASLLAIDPEVLLLDEPTAFLDPEARKDFYEWLSSHKGKRTIVLVDHHLDEILPFADKIIHVDKEGGVSVEQSMPSLNPASSQIISLTKFKQSSIELKLNHVYFHYRGGPRLLEDISLHAKSGEVIVIKGKNGKGKSTLFKLMAGLLPPDQGEICVLKDGRFVKSKMHYKEIGFIFQNPESHFFYDSIKEELRNVDAKNLQEILYLFFQDIDILRSPFLLSEGEKRRLSILLTVFQEKSILLYDEPTFGQDAESKALVADLILQLKAMGKIQIIISHDDNFIKSLDAQNFVLENEHLSRIL